MRTIEQAVADCYAGYQASAAKRGRNPRFPYVPIFKWPSDRFGIATTQIQGKAFEDRDRAVAYAARYIERMKQNMRDNLAKPGCRALRQQWDVAA